MPVRIFTCIGKLALLSPMCLQQRKYLHASLLGKLLVLGKGIGMDTSNEQVRIFEDCAITSEEALDTFRQLIEKYFDANASFGSVAKSEIDLLMFGMFEKAFVQSKKPDPVGDFEMALKLNITPSRVQTLRTKVALREGMSCDAGKILLDLMNAESYDICPGKDGASTKIKLLFSTKIEMLAFKDELQKKRMFHDLTFNSLVVKTSLATVITLLLSLVDKNLPDSKDGKKMAKKGPLLDRSDFKKLEKQCEDDQAQAALEGLRRLSKSDFAENLRNDRFWKAVEGMLRVLTLIGDIGGIGKFLGILAELVREACSNDEGGIPAQVIKAIGSLKQRCSGFYG